MARVELSAFVDAHMAKPWAPGEVDCLLVLADWAMALGYPDAAAHLRGTYDSEEGFRTIIAEAGGAVPLVDDCTARIGAARASEAAQGFIGVIGSRTNMHRQWGGIWSAEEKSWFVRFENAFQPVKAHPLAIWKL